MERETLALQTVVLFNSLSAERSMILFIITSTHMDEK
jgi:hypothetical protein